MEAEETKTLRELERVSREGWKHKYIVTVMLMKCNKNTWVRLLCCGPDIDYLSNHCHLLVSFTKDENKFWEVLSVATMMVGRLVAWIDVYRLLDTSSAQVTKCPVATVYGVCTTCWPRYWVQAWIISPTLPLSPMIYVLLFPWCYLWGYRSYPWGYLS